MVWTFRMRGGAAAMAAAAALLVGCGGGDETDWDAFRPRPATVADIAGQSFTFTDFEHGAVFDPSLARTTTTLGFGGATPDGTAHRLPFTLEADGARSAGTAVLSGARLQLTFAATGVRPPFTPGQRIELDIEADVDDGRIRLTNRASGVQQASAPRD